MYVSNGNCCMQGTWWSEIDNKCMPIIDPFCLESSEFGKCLTCKTGYSAAANQERQSLPEINF